jgi:hypothetical protein
MQCISRIFFEIQYCALCSVINSFRSLMIQFYLRHLIIAQVGSSNNVSDLYAGDT